MIQTIKNLTDNSGKIKKIKKSNLIVRLSMLGAFLFIIAISAIAIFSSVKPPKIAIGDSAGNPTINYQYYYVDIKFLNVKNDNTTEIISAKDFKALYNGRDYIAEYFSADYGETKIEEYKLVHNGKNQSIRVYFEDVYFYFGEEFFYKGELLDYSSNYAPAGEVFGWVAVIECLLFTFIFLTVNYYLKRRYDYKKGERYKQVNEKVFAELAIKNFNITKTFYLSSTKSGATDIEKMMIVVDGKNKKYAFVDYDKNLFKIVDFKDLINYKLIEKNGTNVESQLHYSIFTDSTYSTTSSKDVCKKLQLVFILNDEDDSTIVYEIIKSGLALDSSKYKKISKEMIEITSFFEVVQSKTPKDKKFVYCKHCGVKNDAESSHCSACSSPLD